MAVFGVWKLQNPYLGHYKIVNWEITNSLFGKLQNRNSRVLKKMKNPQVPKLQCNDFVISQTT